MGEGGCDELMDGGEDNYGGGGGVLSIVVGVMNYGGGCDELWRVVDELCDGWGYELVSGGGMN